MWNTKYISLAPRTPYKTISTDFMKCDLMMSSGKSYLHIVIFGYHPNNYLEWPSLKVAHYREPNGVGRVTKAKTFPTPNLKLFHMCDTYRKDHVKVAIPFPTVASPSQTPQSTQPLLHIPTTPICRWVYTSAQCLQAPSMHGTLSWWKRLWLHKLGNAW